MPIKLPRLSISYGDGNYYLDLRIAVRQEDGECTPRVDQILVECSREVKEDSWMSLIHALGMEMIDGEKEIAREKPKEQRYITQVGFLEGDFWAWRIGSAEGLANLVKRFKLIFESERSLRQLGQLVPLQSALLTDAIRARVRAWLPDFWLASYHPMNELERLVKEHDAKEQQLVAEKEKASYEVHSYFYVHKLKLQGWFLRRWINAGRGQAGNDWLVLYRYWLWRIAVEVKLPEAEEWQTQLKFEMPKADTLKYQVEYLSPLSTD